jgi:polysaccharide biosynthesis protein PslG
MPASCSGRRPDSRAPARIPGGARFASRFRGLGRTLLTGLVVCSLFAAAAAPAANASVPKPVLKVSGTTLTWGALSGVNSYVLATILNPQTTRNTTYQVVTGTSFTPPAGPGQTVKYGLRANVSGAPWAPEVTITWPATTATAVSGATTTTTTSTTTSTTSSASTPISTTTSTPVTTSTTTAAPAPTPTSGLVVGLNASVSGWANMSGRMSQVASQAGPKWIRQEFDWSQIEPSRGTFDWSRYDQFMTVTAQAGVRVLPDLMDTPSWDGASWNAIPSDPSDYATFVAAVVARYGPHGTFWAAHSTLTAYPVQTFELWNEPYYSNGNNGVYDPGAYARMVKAAAIAGRSADSGAQFLLAAENTSQLVNSTWVWWVDALYQAVPDLNNYFDGVAVHPYGDDLTSLSFPTVGVAYNGYNQVRRVESIRQEFVNHGASDKPLWLTEIGWPTCSSGSTRCTTQAGQASDLTAVFNYARGSWSSYVKAVFVYCFQDNGADSTNSENDYGLVDYNGNPKAALSVFKAQTSMQ